MNDKNIKKLKVDLDSLLKELRPFFFKLSRDITNFTNLIEDKLDDKIFECEKELNNDDKEILEMEIENLKENMGKEYVKLYRQLNNCYKYCEFLFRTLPKDLKDSED